MISHINDHKEERALSEPDVIITKAIEPYRVKPYSELVKMVNAEPKTIDLKWSCSKAYQVAIWAIWENESNGNICIIGMVNAKEDEDTLIPETRSFIKSPYNQIVSEQDKDRKYKMPNQPSDRMR